MLAFSNIQPAIAAAFQVLTTQINPDYGVKQYETGGGQDTANPWRTAGFYAYENRKSRLVLESSYFESAETCVVRVYRERRLKVFYAKKIVGEADGLEQMVSEAVQVFRASLPAKPVQKEELDLSAFGDMAQSLARLLAPIPPPIRLSEIKQAR